MGSGDEELADNLEYEAIHQEPGTAIFIEINPTESRECISLLETED